MKRLTATRWIRARARIGDLLGALAARLAREERHALGTGAADAAPVAHAAALREQIARAEAAEAQLRQMQKMGTIGQFAGGVAHDVANMLAVVIGNLQLARRHVGDPERLRASIASAEDAARRASQTVTHVLALSRQATHEPRALDVNAIVGDLSVFVGHTLGETVAVETVLADDLSRCVVDATQLENALLNLVINARDAMPDGGVVTIETANATQTEGGAVVAFVMIAVADTGRGMPEAVRSRAFEPFFTTKDDSGGTGLGLAQVARFAEEAGGRVELESEFGAGTTVRIFLPCAAADDGAVTGER